MKFLNRQFIRFLWQMVIDNVVIRLDAGDKFGLGHLSRCISLINKIGSSTNTFIVKSDNENLIEHYGQSHLCVDYRIYLVDVDCSLGEEINIILNHYRENTLLIVDHYNADEAYQMMLLENNIKWLQLDSHAKVNFYADWVMHGSPGATVDLYEPLRRNVETKFLLGPEYCIIKEQLLSHYSERRVRVKLDKVVVCFGGGNDRGATLACLRNIRFDLFQDVEFTVAINQLNPDYKAVLFYQTKGVVKIVPPQELNQAMFNADLAIIAPGMMSYEAAFLGLPMLLITIADNQNINSKAWEETKCALNIGSIVDVPENINKCLLSVKQSPKLLGNMSQNCLNLVDGKGIERIINEITE